MAASKLCIDPVKFDRAATLLRSFFSRRGFVEVHTQNRLSILAACEDPTTLTTYNYAGQVWPLPQTGQMWLEHEMLKAGKSGPEGFIGIATSYRNEQNPVEGRHDLIFPMFEFELKGGMEDMVEMEMDLLEYLGFQPRKGGSLELDPAQRYPRVNYLDLARDYGVRELDHSHEQRVCDEQGDAVLLQRFPRYTDPFFNMRGSTEVPAGLEAPNDLYNKVDVIINGVETIGSAERSCDPDRMLRDFKTLSSGEYSGLLYKHFSRERVDRELDEFLSHDFFPRSGGGIGMTRLIRAMDENNLW